MEDEMFRRIEHKNRKKPVETSEQGSPVKENVKTSEETVVFQTVAHPSSEDNRVSMNDDTPKGSYQIAKERRSAVEVIFGPNNRKKRREALERGEVWEDPSKHTEDQPRQKKTAVEVIFGPNNRKMRKEAEERARAEGRTVDENGDPLDTRKSAVEIIFGPNNRKKRKEEARLREQNPDGQSDDSRNKGF